MTRSDAGGLPVRRPSVTRTRPTRRQRSLTLLYASTAFVAASLVFAVQPMVTKMILPRLGGSPSVWASALVFFQVVLLIGYAYAHVVSTRFRPTVHARAHVVLLLVPLLVLPFSVPDWQPPTHGSLPLWVLGLLAVVAGAPYAAITTASPLLQRWFSLTDHPRAADPYFLYAAGNAGSLLGLLAYPIVIEPHLSVRGQTRLWLAGYVVFVALTLVTVRTIRDPRAAAGDPLLGAPDGGDLGEGPTWRDRARWLALSAVPSSLLVGATTHVTVDVAAVPLLWAVPLALYLLTFVIAFARRRLVPTAAASAVLPGLVAVLAARDLQDRTGRIALEVALHFVTLFVAALACHGRLADERPAARHLTQFFLWVSIGGALGGAFNALLAPVVFNSLLEYPIALALVLLLRRRPRRRLTRHLVVGRRRHDEEPAPRAWIATTVQFAALALAGAAAFVALRVVAHHPAVAFWVLVGGVVATQRNVLAAFLAIAISFGVGTARDGRGYEYRTRTFYGTLSVNEQGGFRVLSHGTTLHGDQALAPAWRRFPTTYYAPTGPFGEAVNALSTDPRGRELAMVGLGSGTSAAYSDPNRHITYFEIDPTVVRIASNPKWFTYLADARGPIDIVLGDARLSLQRQPAGRYGVLALDAFSSDAIPIHLLTTEAIREYLRVLRPDGLLLVHISNRYLDLEPVLSAASMKLGLVARAFHDTRVTPLQAAQGKAASDWVVLARREADLAVLSGHGRWIAPKHKPGLRAWTDQSSDLWSVLSL